MDRRIYNSGPIKHGFGSKSNLEKHKFYDLYCGMVARCTRKTHSSYKNYGGRGIKVLWKSFEEFKNDMYDTYLEHRNKFGKENTLLDRIDNDGNYCKENCRWATRSEQNSNQRRSIYTIIEGKKYCSRDIADLCGICVDGAGDRIKLYNRGKITKEQLLSKEHIKKNSGAPMKIVEIDGVTYNARIISDMCGISIGAASQRITRYMEGIGGKENLLRKSQHE